MLKPLEEIKEPKFQALKRISIPEVYDDEYGCP
jgi:hypothetical protein